MHTFCRRISSPKRFLKRPKLERRESQGDLRPGPPFILASTAAPLEIKNSAAATWPSAASKCSGVWPQALFPEARRGCCGLPVGHNNFKTVQGQNKNIHNHTEQVSIFIFLTTDITFNETICNGFFIDQANKDNVFK